MAKRKLAYWKSLSYSPPDIRPLSSGDSTADDADGALEDSGEAPFEPAAAETVEGGGTTTEIAGHDAASEGAAPESNSPSCSRNEKSPRRIPPKRRRSPR